MYGLAGGNAYLKQVYFRIDKQSEEEEHFLHLSVEEYSGIKLSEKEDWLECYRIVPLGELHFFFSVGKTLDTKFLADSFPTKEVDLIIPQLSKGESVFSDIKVTRVNSLTIIKENDIFNDYYEYLFSSDAVMQSSRSELRTSRSLVGGPLTSRRATFATGSRRRSDCWTTVSPTI